MRILVHYVRNNFLNKCTVRISILEIHIDDDITILSSRLPGMWMTQCWIFFSKFRAWDKSVHALSSIIDISMPTAMPSIIRYVNPDSRLMNRSEMTRYTSSLSGSMWNVAKKLYAFIYSTDQSAVLHVCRHAIQKIRPGRNVTFVAAQTIFYISITSS